MVQRGHLSSWVLAHAVVLGVGIQGTLADARSFRVGLVPNGETFGCVTCHSNPSGGRWRNPFGKAVEALVTPGSRESFWGPQLAGQDADGDGLTNGQELQDPGGTWKPDEPPPGDASHVTNPGVANRPRTAASGKPGSAASGAGSGPKAERGTAGVSSGPRLELDVSSRLRRDRNLHGEAWDGSVFTDIRAYDLGQGTLDLKLAGWGMSDFGSTDGSDQALDREPLRVTEAWGELHGIGPLPRLRLGRQYLYEVDQLHYDGATSTLVEAKPFTVFAFAGRAVTYDPRVQVVGLPYEWPAPAGQRPPEAHYRDPEDEWLGGGGVVWQPTWRDHHQVDAYRLATEDESFALSAWRWRHTWEDAWRTSTRLRFIDDECRDVRGLLFKHFEPWGVDLGLDYYVQPETQGQDETLRTLSLGALGRTLGPRAPYQRLGAEVSKYYGEQWLVQLGGAVRRRIDGAAEDSYNSLNSNEGRVSLTRFNAFTQNLDLTLGLCVIDNEQDSSGDLTGQIAYHPTPEWEFSLGASWSRYRLDPLDFRTDLNGVEGPDLLLEDLTNVVYYVEARWRLNAAYELLAGVDWDASGAFDGSGLMVRIGVRYRLREPLAGKAHQ